MADVFDVAKYVLRERGIMTAMKLQKLVYYCQAWSVVWDEKPLFPEEIQAWASGPVVPALYQVHKGKYQITTIPRGDAAALSPQERETVDGVLSVYGDKSAQWLSDLTHMEAPWIKAREGVPPGANYGNEITLASLEEYYSSL